jgi:hypothetical protein
MGHGSYKSSDWAQLRNSRNINANSTVNDLYQSRGMKEYYDPSKIKVRESRDSEDNPLSTAIIVGLDVTGSMGYLSEEIAKNSLNKTMLEIYDKEPVTNPHIMFQAIGDSKSDRAPLQATQFEADIRIAEQLLDVFFEGGGGGNGGESYCLSWYFADTRTDIDCYIKRGKKGYIFTIGDECCHDSLTREEIKRVFGDDAERDFSAKELYQSAAKKYNIFHIVTKAGSYKNQKSGKAWEKLIPGRVIELEPEQLKYLAELFVSVMQLTEGGNKKDIVGQWKDQGAQLIVADALGRLVLEDNKPGFFKF